MGVNMSRVKFVTTLRTGSDLRWYKRDYHSDKPYVLYLNGKLIAEIADDMALANRTYEEYATM